MAVAFREDLTIIKGPTRNRLSNDSNGAGFQVRPSVDSGPENISQNLGTTESVESHLPNTNPGKLSSIVPLSLGPATAFIVFLSHSVQRMANTMPRILSGKKLRKERSMPAVETLVAWCNTLGSGFLHSLFAPRPHSFVCARKNNNKNTT